MFSLLALIMLAASFTSAQDSTPEPEPEPTSEPEPQADAMEDKANGAKPEPEPESKAEPEPEPKSEPEPSASESNAGKKQWGSGCCRELLSLIMKSGRMIKYKSRQIHYSLLPGPFFLYLMGEE